MQSTIEQTDISEPRSADTSATLAYERGDASTTISGLQSQPARRRRRALLPAVAAVATVGAAAAITIAVVARSEPGEGTRPVPRLVEAPPLADPHGAAGSAGPVPVFVEAPPLAESNVAR